MGAPVIRLLIVDFLDSYTYNIPSYVRQAWQDTSPVSFHILPYVELSQGDIHAISQRYDGVILSPGPGTVDCEDDIGSFVPALLAYRPAIPVFGVCLGFQAICKQFGGSIKRLGMPHHGLISEIHSQDGRTLGRRATRYHSLEVVVSPDLSKNVELLAYSSNFDDTSQTLQEVKVRGMPYWGVQYHPESVYSSGCEAVVRPFLQAALDRAMSDSRRPFAGNWLTSLNADRANLSLPPGDSSAGLASNPDLISAPSSCIGTPVPSETSSSDSPPHNFPQPINLPQIPSCDEKKPLLWKELQIDLDIPTLLHSSDFPSQEFVVLDSSSKSEWNILAFAESSWSFRYSCRRQEYVFAPVSLLRSECISKVERKAASLDEMWAFLQKFSTRRSYVHGPSWVPFWGGFIGYFSYELGLDQLGLNPYPQQYIDQTPEYDDVQLLWSTETMLYHRESKTVYLLSLERDHAWIHRTQALLESLAVQQPPLSNFEGRCPIVHPIEEEYVASIKQCQEHIKAGESYELCLTALSDLHFTPSIQPSNPRETCTQLYAALRNDNPAAFMSIFNLGGVNFISASPEEFLSYDAGTRTASMKPIKGTIDKKRADGTPISLFEAQQELNKPKVVAENLMIVDLVRNDLAKVSDKVTCPNLLWVEELEHMYQLVSTIEANVSAGRDAWDLLRSALPPGSMTGAPKRRSCQLLQRLEKSFRGLYSGIVGYVDVRGNCRTSVSIRNATQYPGLPHWKLGAGGAITSLSDPADEWQERQLKAWSVCRSFEQRFDLLETVLWDPHAGGLALWESHIIRLMASLKHFGFQSPVQALPELSESVDATATASERLSTVLSKWTTDNIPPTQREDRLRLSIKVSSQGCPSLSIVPIGSTPSSQLNVSLDPHATHTDALEPFVSHKTSLRDHYVSARTRSGVQGRDEALLFRPVQQRGSNADRQIAGPLTQPGRPDDILTEGSYTNVAVFSETRGAWITPSHSCLKGIERARMLRAGDIVEGEVRRRDIADGARVKLFNSVRGCFEAVVRLE